MSIKLHATSRLQASAWWDSLSDEQKKGYIEEHPDSKYAKDAKAANPNAKHEPKRKKISELLKKAFSSAPETDKAFYAAGGHEAGSPERRKAATVVKDKTWGIVKNFKEQAKEWKAGFGALKKMYNKEELTHHDKEALKTCAKDLVYTVAATAITGGLAAGVVTAISHMGVHVFMDMSLKAFSHAVVVASDAPDSNSDKVLAAIISQLADLIASGDIPEDLLAKSIANSK